MPAVGESFRLSSWLRRARGRVLTEVVGLPGAPIPRGPVTLCEAFLGFDYDEQGLLVGT